MPLIRIIDLKKIRKNRRPFQAISTEAFIEIEQALKENKKSLFLLIDEA